MRNEKLLSNLEDELSTLNLLKAKQKDPWKLISTPTLIDEPVAPNKLSLFILSLILGAISSSLFFVSRNFRGNYILSCFRLIDLLAFPLLKTFSKNINHSWENDIKLLEKNVINDSEDSSFSMILDSNKCLEISQ